jgi:hypothetical protein
VYVKYGRLGISKPPVEEIRLCRSRRNQIRLRHVCLGRTERLAGHLRLLGLRLCGLALLGEIIEPRQALSGDGFTDLCLAQERLCVLTFKYWCGFNWSCHGFCLLQPRKDNIRFRCYCQTRFRTT